MGSEQLRDRLDLLEQRIGRIERHLGIAGGSSAERLVEKVSPPVAAEQSPAESHAQFPPMGDWLSSDPLPPQPPPRDHVVQASEVIKPPAQSPARATPGPAHSYELFNQRPDVERLIGLKWSGWVGAVVLAVGAALGVQFGYEHHWFGHLPPVFRLALIFVVGSLLIAAGEAVLRRINPIPAASLFGAGVSILFLGAYAGHAYFELYSRTTSMTLMALATLIGAAVAMRGNMVSIAILSLIGANLAPVLVATPNAPVVPFMFYLLMMQVVALVLAHWGRGGKWWVLRGLSLGPTAGWMALVLAGPHGGDGAVITFLLTFAALYHAELILSVVKESAADKLARGGPLGTAFALAVTAVLTFGVLSFYWDARGLLRGNWAIGLAAASFAMGFGLPWLNHSLGRLAMSHRIAAAGLVVLSIPLYFSGVQIEIGWMLLAVAFAVTWRLTRSTPSRAAACATWLLGLCHLAFNAANFDRYGADVFYGDTWLTLWGTAIGSTAILAWLFALSGHMIAALIAENGDDNQWRRGVGVMASLCGLIWVVASIAGLPNLGASAWIIVYAWAALFADRAMPRLELCRQAGGALLTATAKWAVVDTLAKRLSPDWANSYPVFNPLTGVGLLASASLVGFYRLAGNSPWQIGQPHRRDSATSKSRWDLAVAAAAIALVTVSLTFEIDRTVVRAVNAGWTAALPDWQVRQLSWTMLWSFAAAVLMWATARLAKGDWAARCRRAMWLLTGLLALKFVIIDTLAVGFDPAAAALPVLNLQVLGGLAVIGCAAWGRTILRTEGESAENDRSLNWRLSVLVAGLIAWMGILEINRFVLRVELPAHPADMIWHFSNLGADVWLTLVAATTLLYWRRTDASAGADEPWRNTLPAALQLVAVKYLLIDAIAWRAAHDPPAGWQVVLNWDVLTAAIVLAEAALPTVLAQPAEIAASKKFIHLRRRAGALTVAILLVAGTLEIDRAFCLPSVQSTMADAALAEQMGFSIFWACFAVAALAIGFWKRAAALRYFSLSLLALTLAKVMVVDLGQVTHGYRILSFLGLGMLLLGTSVMYGRVSPRLLRQATLISPAVSPG